MEDEWKISGNETLSIVVEKDTGFSIQDRVLIGAVTTLIVLVILALVLRLLKQPCKHRVNQSEEEKKDYDKYSTNSSLEDSSSDVSFRTSSSGYSESSGRSSQVTQLSYCSSEFSLKSDDRLVSISSSLPDLTGKNSKSINISSPSVFTLNTELMSKLSCNSEQIKSNLDDTGRTNKSTCSIKSVEHLNSSLSNSFLSLASSQLLDTNSRNSKNITVEHAYGKYLPKFYKYTELKENIESQSIH
ncbi:uncharacterized protein LOC133193380 [Saccostrea echinata]|uniref:uncharacterized protein LOC133193380 n=1 Tax=Saccostrea echinata TaxID=191078 RepID=UPI002A83BC15|nr:uncharacterized protein LOC133193380 [Saccostrea echinata]XP_061185303.1 uncharacterized protein LOC133193380 [Saccostrea echinata]